MYPFKWTDNISHQLQPYEFRNMNFVLRTANKIWREVPLSSRRKWLTLFNLKQTCYRHTMTPCTLESSGWSPVTEHTPNCTHLQQTEPRGKQWTLGSNYFCFSCVRPTSRLCSPIVSLQIAVLTQNFSHKPFTPYVHRLFSMLLHKHMYMYMYSLSLV